MAAFVDGRIEAAIGGLPSFCTSFDCTNVLFFDGFDDLSGIDFNNTLLPGKKWYLNNIGTFGANTYQINPCTFDKGFYSAVNSKLEITGNTSSNRLTGSGRGDLNGWQLASHGYLGAGNGFVNGVPLINGDYTFYIEFCTKSAAASYFVNWIMDSHALQRLYEHGPDDSITGFEVDCVEQSSAGAVGQNNHRWNSTDDPAIGGAPIGGGAPVGWDTTGYHKFGFFSVPRRLNNGTGTASMKFDRADAAGAPATWTGSDLYSIESSRYQTLINGPQSLEYVICLIHKSYKG